MTIKEILEKIDTETIVAIMQENGSPVFKKTKDGRTGQELLWFRTICHGGDSHKLCYFTETKDFYCYTSCGKMSIFTLIQRILDLPQDDFKGALLYLCNKANINLKERKRNGFGAPASVVSINEEFDEITKLKEEQEILENKRNIKINNFYDPKCINYFDLHTFHESWIKEGISIESMIKYKIGFYWYMNHIIIPHYDIDNNLVGIRRRSLNPEDANNKYMPEIVNNYTFSHPLGLNLYGININKNAIEKSGTAIIVEGEKSVLLSDTYYGDKSIALATCGFNVSDYQIRLLKKLGVEKVYLGFDKDYDITKEDEYKNESEESYKGFLRYKERIESLAQKMSLDFNVKILYDNKNLLDIKDSPMDKGKEVLEQLIKDAKTVKVKY